MSIRSEILAILSDPTLSYLTFICGAVLIIVEFLRPGKVLPGVSGAVAIAVALYSLTRWNWAPHGAGLLVASILIAVSGARVYSYFGPALSGVLFALGSAMLVTRNGGIHPLAAFVGGVLAMCVSRLLQVAYSARVAKCHR